MLFKVSGISFDRRDNQRRFEEFTKASSAKEAVNNVRWRLSQRYKGCIMRNVDVEEVELPPVNAQQLSLF